MSDKFNFKGIMLSIEEILNNDVEVRNQSYDYSSPVKDGEKAPFMSPKPLSPKRRSMEPCILVSGLGKRTFDDAFNQEDYEDERYNQHISYDFFHKNIGHNVVVEEGEIYEGLEDIWPDYPSQEDFFFNEDEY